MKAGSFYFLFFVAGILTGIAGILPAWITQSSLDLYTLYLLLFLVGCGIGSDTQAVQNLLRLNLRTLLLPGCVAIGSILGAGILSFLLRDINLMDSMAVGAGFGYYSLSSILIAQIRGEELGVIALLANVFREVGTLLFAPFYARFFGKLAPIASGGATSMDTTLPVIQKYSGIQYAILSVINGVILSIAVPILVPLILA